MSFNRIWGFGLMVGLAVGCMPIATDTPTSTVLPPAATTETLLPTITEEPYPIAPIATFSNAAYPYPQATLNPIDETIVADKATMAAKIELTLTAQPTSTPQPTGTYEYGDLWGIPGWNLVIYVANTWYGIVNDKKVRVFSGAYRDSDQGVFYIMFPLAGYWFERLYETPTVSGAIRVADEQNNRLKFSAKNGDVFYFDIPGLQFVASFDEPVPTVTPPSGFTITLTAYP